MNRRTSILLISVWLLFTAGVAQIPDKTYSVNALPTYGVRPTIDGTVSAGEWDDAATPGCTGFVVHDNPAQAAVEDPIVKAVFDYHNLYILYQVTNSNFALAFDPWAGDPDSDYRDPTNAVYTGDDFEVFLAPAGPNYSMPGNSFYHIVFFPYQTNSVCYIWTEGSSATDYPGAASWNPTTDQAAFSYNTGAQLLTIEYSIPWTEFSVAPDALTGHPLNGAAWGCQLGYINNSPSEAVNWEPDPTGGFVLGRPYGEWVFSGTPPPPSVPPTPTPIPLISFESVIATTATLNAVGPYNVATDANGGLCFATFDGPNSDVYYIADPVSAPNTIVNVGHTDFAAFPTLRGIQGLSVDSAGNIYVTGDVGSGFPPVDVKLGPPPSFIEDTAFVPPITGGRRWLGNALLSDSLLVLAQFNSLVIVNTSDGAEQAGIYIDNTTNYQRDLAVNPLGYDIFASRNGNNAIGGIVQWTGGSPAAPASYTRQTLAFIDNLEDAGTFGTGTLGLGFYGPLSWLLVNDKNSSRLDIYRVSGVGAAATKTLEQSISGSESGLNLSATVDAAMADYGNVHRLFISDFLNNRILVYVVQKPTGVNAFWTMME